MSCPLPVSLLVTCVLLDTPCWLHHVHRQTKSSIAAITITLPATVTQGPTSMKFLQRIEPSVWLIDGCTIIYLRGFHGFFNVSPHPQLRTCDLCKLYRERRDLTYMMAISTIHWTMNHKIHHHKSIGWRWQRSSQKQPEATLINFKVSVNHFTMLMSQIVSRL